MNACRVDDLVRFYETLTPESVGDMGRIYAEDAFFKDPFNEVQSLPAIKAIFARMFQSVACPRFTVTERIVGANSAALTWTFEFSTRGLAILVRGASVLRFGPDGRVVYHRDYWDVAEELYEKLPVVGTLMRWMKRRAG